MCIRDSVVTIDFSEAANLTTIKSQGAMGAPLTGVLDLSNTKVQTIEKSACLLYTSRCV